MNITTQQWTKLVQFLPRHQLAMVQEFAELQSLMPDLLELIDKTPALYVQDGLGKDSLVYLHYFVYGCDWWITEVDKETKEAFGYVCLNGDWINSEFGYISIEELTTIDTAPIELDFHWTIKPLKECIK